MKGQAVLYLALRQLALEDPIRFGAVQDAEPGRAMPGLVQMIREVIDEAVGVVGETEDQGELLRYAWLLLTRENEMVNHVASMLWGASVILPIDAQRSPLLSALTQEDVGTWVRTYVQALQTMDGLIARVQVHAGRLPVTDSMLAELEHLPRVFEFLAGRRSRLRVLVHSRYRRDPFLSEGASRADRADEVLGLYHTVVMGGALVETPAHWTLRGQRACLEQNMRDLLGDMMHLAAAEKVDWEQVLREARESYQSDQEDET
jgi:hypothetical protein